jgi:hypothetical protein
MRHTHDAPGALAAGTTPGEDPLLLSPDESPAMHTLPCSCLNMPPQAVTCNQPALPPRHSPGWLDALTKCRSTLEEVNKALEDYLETKRGGFPR